MRIEAKDVSKIFKLNDDGRSAQQWAKGKKLKATKENRKWLFNIHDVIQFGYENGYINIELTDKEELAPNIRKDLADAKLKEHKLDVEHGKYYSKEEINKKAEYLVLSSRNKFLAIPSKIATSLIGVDEPTEIEAILNSAVYEALEELSNLDDMV